MSFVGFSSLSPLRNITSSSVTKMSFDFFAIFGTACFIHSDRGTQFVSSEFQNFWRENGGAPYYNYALPSSGKWPKRALQRNCVEGRLVPVTLRKPPTRSRRPGHLSIPSPRRVTMTASFDSKTDSRNAPWLKADPPAYIRKLVRAKDQTSATPNKEKPPLTLQESTLAMGELTRFLPVTSLDDRRMLTMKVRSRNQAVSAETR